MCDANVFIGIKSLTAVIDNIVPTKFIFYFSRVERRRKGRLQSIRGTSWKDNCNTIGMDRFTSVWFLTSYSCIWMWTLQEKLQQNGKCSMSSDCISNNTLSIESNFLMFSWNRWRDSILCWAQCFQRPPQRQQQRLQHLEIRRVTSTTIICQRHPNWKRWQKNKCKRRRNKFTRHIRWKIENNFHSPHQHQKPHSHHILGPVTDPFI